MAQLKFGGIRRDWMSEASRLILSLLNLLSIIIIVVIIIKQ